MLLQYVVSNFKSIGHPVEFSMFPVQETMDERFLKSILTKGGTWKVLCRGGFFGPNASGKSSFINRLPLPGTLLSMAKKAEKVSKLINLREKLKN